MTNILDLTNFHTYFQQVIPKLDENARKGTSGRIGVIGGSKDYTGAPYYAAKSSLRVGGDLAYVVCCKTASQTIKSYSPELIVSPILDDPLFKTEFTSLVSKLHSIVVGPGLGRQKEQFTTAGEAIRLARQYEIPVTIDADAVLLIAESPDLIKGYLKAIITPNAREFDYLCDKIGIGGCNVKINDMNEIKSKVIKLSNALEGVTVVRKGKVDIISNGKMQAECSTEGSFRRCGGQGDILAGSIGTFSYWAHANEQNSFKGHAAVIAAMAGCCLTRRTNFLTFRKLGRSMLTTDMLENIGPAFESLGFK